METQKTALYDYHKTLGAKFVSFAGYEMPIQYKEGIIKEVTVGDNTNASKRIIDSLTKVLKNKIVKFEKHEILKKINTFSIIIVYKLK